MSCLEGCGKQPRAEQDTLVPWPLFGGHCRSPSISDAAQSGHRAMGWKLVRTPPHLHRIEHSLAPADLILQFPSLRSTNDVLSHRMGFCFCPSRYARGNGNAVSLQSLYPLIFAPCSKKSLHYRLESFSGQRKFDDEAALRNMNIEHNRDWCCS